MRMGIKRAWHWVAAAIGVGISCLVTVRAEIASINYQLCQEKEVGAASQTILSNYRYPKAAGTRRFSQLTQRCEAAWSVEGFHNLKAFDCGWEVLDCKQVDGTCQWAANDDWMIYGFLGESSWQDKPTYESAWYGNPKIKVHSIVPGVQKWVGYRWNVLNEGPFPSGVVERQNVSTAGKGPNCYGMAYLIGFFNGVWNTRKDAEDGLGDIEDPSFIGPSYLGSPIRYHLFYNQTGCDRAGASCLEDLAEVFIQRSDELDGIFKRRWEYLWEQITGESQARGSLTDLLRNRITSGAQALVQWLDALKNASLAKIVSLMARLVSSPPTAADTANHVAELVRSGQQAYRAVLLAHSQGNLFANAAYRGYLAHSRQAGAAAGQDTNYVAAQVIHVAPASAELYGPHVLAETDLVIEGLRRVDGTPIAVNTLRRDEMPISSADPSGHKLVSTYLNPERPTHGIIKALIVKALNDL